MGEWISLVTRLTRWAVLRTRAAPWALFLLQEGFSTGPVRRPPGWSAYPLPSRGLVRVRLFPCMSAVKDVGPHHVH